MASTYLLWKSTQNEWKCFHCKTGLSLRAVTRNTCHGWAQWMLRVLQFINVHSTLSLHCYRCTYTSYGWLKTNDNPARGMLDAYWMFTDVLAATSSSSIVFQTSKEITKVRSEHENVNPKYSNQHLTQIFRQWRQHLMCCNAWTQYLENSSPSLAPPPSRCLNIPAVFLLFPVVGLALPFVLCGRFLGGASLSALSTCCSLWWVPLFWYLI